MLPQFTDDGRLAAGISRAQRLAIDDVELLVLSARDLLAAKLRAARDPARRRSKRTQDMADAQALLEQSPELLECLSHQQRSRLARLLG